ncbi:hypothetical protein [Amycolatopsis sp. NPDC051102]|uniref:hypothetical protein n=1 Tax=Amycolatopsis sp. NPDC051102 TaxID=3155163 RepID=UPI00342629EC
MQPESPRSGSTDTDADDVHIPYDCSHEQAEYSVDEHERPTLECPPCGLVVDLATSQRTYR